MTAYYNDIEPYALEVIGRRIAAGDLPDGTLDSRSITEITAADIGDADEAHLFAGMGGWPLALRMAGYDGPYPVWTGSCPCQPFSSAGKRRGTDDERDLWDDFVRLIREGRPAAVFGEQVASSETVGTQLEADFALAVRAGRFAQANKLAHRLARSKSLHWHQRWVDRIQADLAAEGYALRFDVLGAHSVEAPHPRQRIFFGAVRLAEPDRIGESESRRFSGAVSFQRGARKDTSECRGDRDRLGDTRRPRSPKLAGQRHQSTGSAAPDWNDQPCILVECREPGRDRPVYRRAPAEPALFPVAHGLPGRVARLKVIGNAIVPQVAAEFVRAFMASINGRGGDE